MVRVKEKGASGHNNDLTQKYSVHVNIKSGEKTHVYLKCNYCDKIAKMGVSKMKEYLSGFHRNVAPCAKILEEV